MGREAVTWILLIFCVKFGWTACPNNLGESCICEVHMGGLDVACQQIRTDLNTFLKLFGDSRIDRLTVIQSTWPILKRVPSVNIRSLRLIDCGINKVVDEAFVPVSGTLEELVIVNNSLIQFPVLGVLPRLQTLSFNYNKLIEIPENSLDGVGHLRQLRLEGNRIYQLPSSLLSTSKNSLNLVDVSGNILARVPADALSNCVNLMYLDLSENQIGIIGSLDFRNLPKLKELRLNHNRLGTVQQKAFKNVPQLQYLYLQGNSLSNVDAFSFVENFRRLEILDLSNNSFTKVPPLKNHESIRQVKLDYNKLRTIDSHAFGSIPRLQLISLQNNAIESLAEDSFFGLNHLTILLLENNFIRKLDKKMLAGISSLQQLDLRNNLLRDLEDDTFLPVPQLKMVDLSHNGFKEIPKTLFAPLRKVIWLELSHNSISSFEEGTFIYRIPHIILVDNPLRCDEKMDWFVAYLVRNQVRTHLPVHREVTCSSPQQYAGVRLLDLLNKKAQEKSDAFNKTVISEPMKNELGLLQGELSAGDGKTGVASAFQTKPLADTPVVENKAQAGSSPQLGFNFNTNLVPETMGSLGSSAWIEPGLDFTQIQAGKLFKIFHRADISGIPKKMIETSLQGHLQMIYEAAANFSSSNSPKDRTKYSSILDGLPKEFVTDVIRGAKLPYLNEEQLQVIKKYYVSKLSENDSSKNTLDLSNIALTPELFKMIQLLPPKYDLRKIPKEVIHSISRGEMPDLDLVPADLQQHFLANFPKMFESSMKQSEKSENPPKNAPKLDRADVTTSSPGLIGSDSIFEEGEFDTQDPVYYYALLLICLAAVVSAIILGACCYHRNRRGQVVADESSFSNLDKNSFLVSTPRPIRPRSSAIQICSHSPDLYDSPSCNFPRPAPRHFL